MTPRACAPQAHKFHPPEGNLQDMCTYDRGPSDRFGLGQSLHYCSYPTLCTQSAAQCTGKLEWRVCS